MPLQNRLLADLDYCLRREVEERDAAAHSDTHPVRETHFALAERYADRAWSLSETLDGPPLVSGLWPTPPGVLPTEIIPDVIAPASHTVASSNVLRCKNKSAVCVSSA